VGLPSVWYAASLLHGVINDMRDLDWAGRKEGWPCAIGGGAWREGGGEGVSG
jgi:hypothetical protein